MSAPAVKAHDCATCRLCADAGLTLTDWQHALAVELVTR